MQRTSPHPDTCQEAARLSAEALREGWNPKSIYHVSQNTTHILYNLTGHHEFIISPEVVCTLYIFLYALQNADVSITTRCVGPGAQVEVRILHIQRKSEQLTLRTLQHHEAPHTQSSVLVKGVLYDKARLDYRGNIYVAPTAEETHADQKSHTLVLSADARAQATPGLEVLTKKVRCKHGSAVATLPDAVMEYLAARGIPRAIAQQILVESFFLAALEHEDARQFFLVSLAQKRGLR